MRNDGEVGVDASGVDGVDLDREKLTHYDATKAERRARKNSRAAARWSSASNRSLSGRMAPSKEREFHSSPDRAGFPGETT